VKSRVAGAGGRCDGGCRVKSGARCVENAGKCVKGRRKCVQNEANRMCRVIAADDVKERPARRAARGKQTKSYIARLDH